MDVTVFGTKPYDRTFLDAAVGTKHNLYYLDLRLTAKTAVLAKGSKAVCAFVNDQVDADAGLGGLQQAVNQRRIGQRVELQDDTRLAPRNGGAPHLRQQLQHPAVQVERGQ